MSSSSTRYIDARPTRRPSRRPSSIPAPQRARLASSSSITPRALRPPMAAEPGSRRERPRHPLSYTLRTVRCAQVRLDPRRGLQQRRQQRPADDVLARPAGVGGDVDRGDDRAVAVADRDGDRAQPLLELLVDERPALRADAGQLAAQLGLGGERARGQRPEVGALQVGVSASSDSAASWTRPIEVA